MAVVDGRALGPARASAFGGPSAAVGDAAEGADQEHDVVVQLRRARRVLDAAAPPGLRHRSAVAVEQALQHGDPDLGCVEQVLERHELRRGAGAARARSSRSTVVTGLATVRAAAGPAKHVVDLALPDQLDPVER